MSTTEGLKHPERLAKLQVDQEAATKVGSEAEAAKRREVRENLAAELREKAAASPSFDNVPSDEAMILKGACGPMFPDAVQEPGLVADPFSLFKQASAGQVFKHEREQLHDPKMKLSVSADGQWLQVQKCRACGLDHPQSQFRILDAMVLPYTHFYTCPKTMSPVLCTILVAGDRKLQAVEANLLQELALAMEADKYMVVVFRIGFEPDDPEPKVLMRRLQFGFPTEDYKNLPSMLAEALAAAAAPGSLGEKPKPAEKKPAPLREIAKGVKLPEGVNVVSEYEKPEFVSSQDDAVKRALGVKPLT